MEAEQYGIIGACVAALVGAIAKDRIDKRKHETTETRVELEAFERVSEREAARLISDNERLRDDVESLRARLELEQDTSAQLREAAANARSEAFAEAARMNRAAMVQALEELHAKDSDDAPAG